LRVAPGITDAAPPVHEALTDAALKNKNKKEAMKVTMENDTFPHSWKMKMILLAP